MQWAKRQTGFTIVELLIVVVVIAILAAITIISYNGITNRTHDTTVQSNLNSVGKRLEEAKIENGDKIPAVADWAGLKVAVSKGSYGNGFVTGGKEYNLLYCRNDTTFAIIAATKSGKIYRYNSGQGVTEYTASSFLGSANMCPNAGNISTGSTGYDNGWAYSADAWTSMVQ